LVSSNTYVKGNNSTVTKKVGDNGVTFSNLSAVNATGYGAGGKNISFVEMNWQGPAYTGSGGAGSADITCGWNHIDGLTYRDCKFSYGMLNGHYIDLGGCRDVRVINCTFLGMNPIAGREYIEAVQVDISSYGAASWKGETPSSYDALPTRRVLVDGCYFGQVDTNYPTPNPFGSHGAGRVGDDGYYEDLVFTNNVVSGTYIPATSTLSGWVHFYGARNVDVSNNLFHWTGASGVVGNPQVVTGMRVSGVTAVGDAANPSPPSTALSTPRQCYNVTIANNKFIGFGSGPSQADTGLVTFSFATGIIITGNVLDDSKASFVRLDTCITSTITNNSVETSTTEPALLIRNNKYGVISQNNIIMNNAGIGIQNHNGGDNSYQGNVIANGDTAIRCYGADNAAIQNNWIRGHTNIGISVGEAGMNTNYDTIVSGNRVRNGALANTFALKIGAASTRTRTYGNLFREGGTYSDSGTGTTTVATDQTT
jgi:hypothetical protein